VSSFEGFCYIFFPEVCTKSGIMAYWQPETVKPVWQKPESTLVKLPSKYQRNLPGKTCFLGSLASTHFAAPAAKKDKCTQYKSYKLIEHRLNFSQKPPTQPTDKIPITACSTTEQVYSLLAYERETPHRSKYHCPPPHIFGKIIPYSYLAMEQISHKLTQEGTSSTMESP
jgi:hypothetical protein